jgi:hypothetical protein
MNTSVPFQTQFRPELSLKRRGHSSMYASGESDSSEPFETEMSGPNGQAALQAAWDKLYRARAILEAEQAHLRDDRIALQGEIDLLDVREQEVAARELRMQQMEEQYNLARAEQEEAREALESESAISRLTKAPFSIARSVFGKKE